MPLECQYTLESLPWDSRHFEIPVAQLRAERLSDRELHSALVQARDSGFHLVYWPCDPDIAVPEAILEEFSGLLVDRRVTFESELGAVAPIVPSRPQIPFSIAEYPTGEPDERLIALAIAAGHLSRFRRDPRIPREKFEKLYELWIRRSTTREIANVVLVISNGAQKPTGMVTISLRGALAHIGLIAVDEACRGQGAGSLLMSAARQWMVNAGADRAIVVTQVDNISACKLYERHGYAAVEHKHYYHFWLTPSRSTSSTNFTAACLVPDEHLDLDLDSVRPTLLCIATKKGQEVLDEAIRCGVAGSLVVCVGSESHTAERHDEAIREAARDAGIPLVPWSAFRDRPIPFLVENRIEAIMCIGWRYLIPAPAVAHLDGAVIVAHDALLPRLRGFAPLATALIIGESETGVTFLRAGAEVDGGDIYWQKSVPITPTDTIGSLVDKVCPLYREGARLYFEGRLPAPVPQDHSQATFSIWRDELDYRIDWTNDAQWIERTIRALGRPYLGAQSRLAGAEVVVQSADVVADREFAIRQPGKIWRIDEAGCPTVVCGRGLLKVTSLTDRQGRSVLPVKCLRQRFG
jgi:methionyl-tRNA formyltransferase